MAKKNVQNRANIIDDELLSEFTKIHLNNIKEFFEHSSTLFIAVSIEGVKKSIKKMIANQFINREQFIKDKAVRYHHIYDGQIMSNSVKIHTSELESDYNDNMSDLKTMIKEYINKDVLYAKKM